MRQKTQNYRRKPPLANQKVSLNALTVVQQYLPTNFIYKRLAFTSKNIRKALFSCALRKNRHLNLLVQCKEMSPISSKTVKQMVKFSEIITISVDLEQNEMCMIKNLNHLSGYLLGTLCLNNLDKNFSSTKLNISTSNNIINSILTSEPETLFAYSPLVDPLHEGRLDNLLNLMNYIKGFREVRIRNI
ncbi:hypothetical protein FGO68_gene16298 [Halteria grandinella]|uniref:Uncharacterized protein n=1 Tax=Halteria grandinella TaxID=5974 RepID=A0A8J8TAG1_HALGN|nr:hypothetical protein FGO68_gene16298 [Halteria grandinella]